MNNSKILFSTGKGGTGKSAVSAILGLLIAAREKLMGFKGLNEPFYMKNSANENGFSLCVRIFDSLRQSGLKSRSDSWRLY